MEMKKMNDGNGMSGRNPDIQYTEEKKFTQEQIVSLFQSVGWTSALYPTRLYKALMHSSTVITAWDRDRLTGLARVLDDTELTAYLKYVLVDPRYQGMGIAGQMVDRIREKYRDYLYIDGMPEESRNASFYEKHGFQVMEDGVPMEIHNADEKLMY